MTYQEELFKAAMALFPDQPLVFGEGLREHPPLMLIGEAPGVMEVQQERPFVGKAGKNLDAFLHVLELQREDIYISNTVKIRPSKVSAKGTVSNRPPNKDELAFFVPWLYREIVQTNPRLLVTLGNTPLQAVLSPKATIGAYHGQVVEATIQWEGEERIMPLFPLYHPASIIYNRSLKDVYEADLLKLKEELVSRGLR